MRNALLALLVGGSALIAAPVIAQPSSPPQQSGPADLCQALVGYAEMKLKEPPKQEQGQAASPSSAPKPRGDGNSTGTQGGGSVDHSSSSNTSNQSSAPTTAPVASGAAPEAASSPHATDGTSDGQGATPAGAPVGASEFELAGGISVQQVRVLAKNGDRQACRDTAQTIRRAGADMPAELIALAAYEPDPAKRK